MSVFSIKRELVRAILEEDCPEASAGGMENPALRDPERLPAEVRQALEWASISEGALDREVTHLNPAPARGVALAGRRDRAQSGPNEAPVPEPAAVYDPRQWRGGQLEKAAEALGN